MATNDDEAFQSAMHALISEVDEDHYRPGTPPASPSPSPSPPPHKRQRLDDSDTDDDNVQEATGDFVDDEPNHDLAVPYELPFLNGDRETVREDTEFLRGLVASFEEQALQERERERVGREREVDEDVSLVSPLTPLMNSPLHTFYVSSHWEHRLVDFMGTLDGITLVGTPGPSSRMVFFETCKLAAVVNAVRKWMWAHCVWFRAPQEISPFEVAPLLNIHLGSAPDPTDMLYTDVRYSCFGRLKSAVMGGLYWNDLVFIDQLGKETVSWLWDELFRFSGDGGHIVAIFERREGCNRVCMAVVSRLFQVADLAPTQCFVQPVSSLRLHALSWRRAVNVGDHVVVVAGSGFREYSGRIFDFPVPGAIRFESLEPEALEVDVALRHVRLDFRRGDIVRGKHKDKIGLIVALCLAGYMEVYVCDAAQINNCLCPSFMSTGTDFSAGSANGSKPRTRWACTDTGEDLSAEEHATSRREAAMSLDRVRHKWELDLMRTGRFVVGMFVRVIGKHQKKGQFGMIQDYCHIVPTPDGDSLLDRDAEWGDIRKDVRISVRMDGSYLVEDLSLADVVERDSGLAVLMALLLQEFRKVKPFKKEVPEPREPSPPILQLSDLTDAEVHALSGSTFSPAISPPGVGEMTGFWLTHRNLIGKCIDVRVESLEFLYNLAKQPNVGNKTGPRVTKVASLCGYGKDANVPVVALRPLRTTPVPGETGAVSCISARQCRVIIIGPDVSGDHTRIGEYAETIPSLPPSSTNIVRVHFAWVRLSDGSHRQVNMDYHVECLCHSLNQDTPTPADVSPITRTDFDKKS
ncbi:hypothetical protein GGX14DRAFT_390940 [Mycena pura]|uniref:Chromatin elongation factor spt5 n=1 Tax=Mycena pura TaxID=153505 RepID=A0AAD6VM48_9AGAR|nr:hypothetical protein GGX14DRAFT_390940 [Mycena pura]